MIENSNYFKYFGPKKTFPCSKYSWLFFQKNPDRRFWRQMCLIRGKKNPKINWANTNWLLLTGPLGAVSTLATTATSEANSTATSRTGSRENLCEECIQNPLDLIDASIQVNIYKKNPVAIILLHFDVKSYSEQYYILGCVSLYTNVPKVIKYVYYILPYAMLFNILVIINSDSNLWLLAHWHSLTMYTTYYLLLFLYIVVLCLFFGWCLLEVCPGKIVPFFQDWLLFVASSCYL